MDLFLKSLATNSLLQIHVQDGLMLHRGFVTEPAVLA